MTVDSRVLAQIKATVSGFLTDSALIEKQVLGQDDYGFPTNSWVTVASNVSCRVITLRTPTDQGGAIGSQESLTESYRFICPVGTALDVDQRITVNSNVYQVTMIRDDLTNKAFSEAVMTRARTS